jgi:hypothetical protein
MAFGVCCAFLMLLGSAHAENRWLANCATEAERKLEIEKFNETIDWYLSQVEEVPEGIARQFKDVVRGDPRTPPKAVREAYTHPLWRAHWVRASGADLKRVLGGPQYLDTPETRLKGAIKALEESGGFGLKLQQYAEQDRYRRISQAEWDTRHLHLRFLLSEYAQCLVDDLVSQLAGGRITLALAIALAKASVLRSTPSGRSGKLMLKRTASSGTLSMRNETMCSRSTNSASRQSRHT